jgi:hypothetical protein
MLFVGVDVSKNRLDCAVITDDTGKLLGQRSFLNASEDIDRLLSWLRRLSGAGGASIHDLPPEEWTPGYAVFRSACSGVMYPMAEWIRCRL